MNNASVTPENLRKHLRLWPGVVAVALQWFVRFVVPVVIPDAGMIAILGGIVGGLVILVWWLFFSRAPWFERVSLIVVTGLALFATSRLVHESIANGMMGMMLLIYSIPLLSLAWVVWAAASRRLGALPRFASMVASILLACGVMMLLRTGGLAGDGTSDLHWRWTKSPEERLLAEAREEPVVPAPAPVAVPTPEKPAPEAPAEVSTARSARHEGAKTGADWPGFRGQRRDGVVPGVRIETDWSRQPPVALWRRPIGPGWSSFAVRGNLFYTQEQRGDDEVVSCYDLTTGEPVWRHRDTARFWESNGGAGPRGTPTLSDGRVYTLGATGILNALDAASGAVVWSRTPATDTGTVIPDWGISSSPLVVDGLVLIAAEGKLAAYDAETGEPRWYGPPGGAGYSSPHLLTIDGVPQIVLLNGGGASSVTPDGRTLWEHHWTSSSLSAPIVQPASTEDGDVLIGDGQASGLRRVAVAPGEGEWTVAERWMSSGLKPFFNDFVVHKGHAFGFDGSILACIDLANGTRCWKGGRYGNGQLVLLPDQDLLLVLSEEGDVALVPAAIDRFTEIARFKAIDGKTWNHPVLVGNVLLVRNGEEMAAFRLSLE
jgi:outer membrane protein assembly factor BamB